MKKILFGIPVVLFILIVYGNSFDKYPAILYTGVVISFISLTAGFYLEYKKHKETFRDKYLVRIMMAGVFIALTWGITLYQMFLMP